MHEPSHRRFSLGIDIGGTFTDIVVYDHVQGRRFSRKVLTTHEHPSRGVVEGVDRVLAEDGVPAAEIGRVVRATTLFTNAMIERKGAVTGSRDDGRLPRCAGDRARAEVRAL